MANVPDPANQFICEVPAFNVKFVDVLKLKIPPAIFTVLAPKLIVLTLLFVEKKLCVDKEYPRELNVPLVTVKLVPPKKINASASCTVPP